MRKKPVYTFATWRVKEGQLTSVLDLLGELASKSVAEEGNLLYEIFQSPSDASTLILFEGYENQEALEKHRDTGHFQTLVLGKIVPLLESRDILLAHAVVGPMLKRPSKMAGASSF